MDISSSIHTPHIPQSSTLSNSVSKTEGIRVSAAKQVDSVTFSDNARAALSSPAGKEQETIADNDEKLSDDTTLLEEKLPADKESSANRESSTNGESSTNKGTSASKDLTEDELLEIEELKRRDTEVRAHEQAHMSAAGRLAQGGANFSFETGPDGNRYAVGGDVSIDTSTVAGDPQATLRKAQQIRRAATAPVDPSSQDRSVAAEASRMEAQARIDIAQEAREKQTEYIDENTPEINFLGAEIDRNEQNIQDTYEKIQNTSVLQEQRNFVDFFI